MPDALLGAFLFTKFACARRATPPKRVRSHRMQRMCHRSAHPTGTTHTHTHFLAVSLPFSRARVSIFSPLPPPPPPHPLCVSLSLPPPARSLSFLICLPLTLALSNFSRSPSLSLAVSSFLPSSSPHLHPARVRRPQRQIRGHAGRVQRRVHERRPRLSERHCRPRPHSPQQPGDPPGLSAEG